MSWVPILPEIQPSEWIDKFYGGTSMILTYPTNQLESNWPTIIEAGMTRGATAWSRVVQGSNVTITLYVPMK